ncbi:MAG: EAL domain-containing protein [Butyrivibrio sp.]|nr:EAL domain-containing protein [Butyrivibrio sp.]
MNPVEKYSFDKHTLEIYEQLTAPFAIFQFVDKRIVPLAISDGLCELYGYKDRSTAYLDIENDMYKYTHPDDVARIANAAYRFIAEGDKYEVIYRSRQPGTSDYRIIHAYGKHVYTDTGVRLAHIWYSDEGLYMEDADQHEIRLNQTLSGALHENSSLTTNKYDQLTGLPNMTYFFDLSSIGNANSRKNGKRHTMLYMDFVGMKFFNSKHGFAEGDRFLRSFANLLSEIFGNTHSCRISADHFAVHTEFDGLEQKLQLLLDKRREINDGKTLPLHIGIYVGPEESVHASVACDRAKLACSALSGKYETAVNYYSQAVSDNAVIKQYIIENIDRAISENWIKLYVQPIIRAVNEQACDVEALARWSDPEYGFLSPASFIPALEDAGLIYKLDLYMLDHILDSLRILKADGFRLLPHSINLSRSDFDSCDIVEEIRRRVDHAGISRDRITIEITESILGSDFEYIKKQIERFQELGFPVWMDDFGSGYSSLNILQSIRFDLIKFDMSFMRKLDENEKSRILLTELMRMATSLGFDTVCEGVETKEQVQFLREIGCSKLQGFYYSKPVPFDSLKDLYNSNALFEIENPNEEEYYESISRVNLFDLGVISSGEENAFNNVYNIIPIAILEITDQKVRYLRSNHSYQDFVKQHFNTDISSGEIKSEGYNKNAGVGFFRVINQCCETGVPAFFDETLQDGCIIHSFIRRININPVTGNVAIAVAILSVRKPDANTSYADIARALSADYYDIFLVDLDTNTYTEYSYQSGGKELSIERHGVDLFESARRDAMTRIYEEDREQFLSVFTREKVIQDLDDQGVFTITYRLIYSGTPTYVNMKVTRMSGGNRIIIGISNIDAHMKEKLHYEELQKQKETFNRIIALSDGYLSLFTVDPKTGNYDEYSSSEDFDSLGAAKEGKDFFSQAHIDADAYFYEPDKAPFKESFTRENVLREIQAHGSYSINYRLIINNIPRPVGLKAAIFKEANEDKLVVGIRAWKDREPEKRLL